MSAVFIWGPGGVGKSHTAIRYAALQKNRALLYTLDPSLRIFDLLHIPNEAYAHEVKISDYAFTVRKTDKNKLFDNLDKKRPASIKVRVFYEQMVKGLQDFRDYLTLIELSDEIEKNDFQTLIIDTPPFNEALGLHRSLFNLRRFFETSLVQFAIKTGHMTWLQGGLKRVFEVARIFSGKKAADQIFDFIEWLTSHTERFSKSARFLEELVFSEQTRHVFIVTPETPPRFLEQIKSFFVKVKNIEFVLNRSLSNYSLPEGNDHFVEELKVLAEKETTFLEILKKHYPHARVEKIPLILMGEDTDEELIEFIQA